MDLFLSAGIDLGDGGRGGRAGRPAVARSLRVPLLNYKVVAEARKRVNFDPSAEQLEVARRYAEMARSPRFTAKEMQVRHRFYDDVLGTVLGYTKYDPDKPYTLDAEYRTRGGPADVALGRFSVPEGTNDVAAPFEMKGPKTTDLDAIPPGQRRSPVQQAWDYAIDIPGSRWVLVSNCIEIRLYAFGRGRDAYEPFDLKNLDDRDEHERLWLVLSSDRLLGGATEALLRDTDSAYRDITGKLYDEYSDLRERLIAFLTGAADGPKLPMAQAIEVAQKLLDRILFVAFAERTDLLPDKLIERAAKARNEWLPQPYWKNFQALFHEVDVGNEGRGIWAYNGGLFASDPVADAIVLPDPLTEELAKLASWDYRSDVPVTVLGHIFEQSITDLEKLRAVSLGKEPPKVSKRKREGVVYTPDLVTRFLAERTIGVTLSERFNALLQRHGRPAPKNGDPIFREDEKEAERALWRDYAASLRSLRIVDPACGSGAFLVAAFDLLAPEYRRVLDHLASLGEAIEFDPFDEIVTKNLYGVDINAESVEITRLALWLKTARNKHRLQNLQATIKAGDSLIDDAKFTRRPFDWRAAFADIFAQGGFDVVIGNPPYVRMEILKPVKPYLEKNYVVAADRADLYAYFFERGVGLLKEGGRLGFISSSTFFRTGSGENLRKFLGDNASIETVIDFGDMQIFEGVTTYPAILTLRKGRAADGGSLSFLKVDGELPKDLDAAFATSAAAMPRARLGASPWQLEDDRLARLRAKIVKDKKTLGDVYGAPLYGIKTGLNEAFVIDQATRDQLVKADPKSADLLRPFLLGRGIRKWHVEPEGNWLLLIPDGWTERKFAANSEREAWRAFVGGYPAIASFISNFEKKARARTDQGQFWWELRACAYYDKFEGSKIIFAHFMNRPRFILDAQKHFFVNKAYMLVCDDAAILSYLNSSAAWFQLRTLARIKRGGYFEAEIQYVEQIVVPEFTKGSRALLAKLGDSCSRGAQSRFDIQSAVRHRILDLAPPARRKLSRKLENW